MSSVGTVSGQVALPPTDAEVLVQQLKSQLHPSDKALSKSQRKKVRKKVTKILQKTLGVCMRLDSLADGDAYGGGEQPPSSEETGACSNRRVAIGQGYADPACTSAQRASTHAPGSLPMDSAGPGRLGHPEDAAAAVTRAMPPPPKRRRLHADTIMPKRGGSNNKNDSAHATHISSGCKHALVSTEPQPRPAARSQKRPAALAAAMSLNSGAGQMLTESVPGATLKASAAGTATESFRRAVGGSARGGDSCRTGGGGSSCAGKALSGSSSQLSQGALKRLSRRQARPEDLLTVDDGSGGYGGMSVDAGLSLALCDSEAGASAVMAAEVMATVGRASSGGWRTMTPGKWQDRRQRGRKREKQAMTSADGDGADALTMASEVDQVPPLAASVAAATAAAAAAAAATVHGSYVTMYGGAFVAPAAFAGPLSSAVARAQLVPNAGSAVGAAAMGLCGGTVVRRPVDLSAALLMMRVQLRTAADADEPLAEVAMAAEATVPTVVTDDNAPTVTGSDDIMAAVAAIAAETLPGGDDIPGLKPMPPRLQSQLLTKPKLSPSKAQRTAQEAAARASLYRYGNYHRYYGYRLGADLDEDPRVKLMQREWFSGRVCMDVGCNEGLVTLAVAARFGAKRMMGYDIDGALIKKACRNLRLMRTQYTTRLQALTMGGCGGGGGLHAWESGEGDELHYTADVDVDEVGAPTGDVSGSENAAAEEHESYGNDGAEEGDGGGSGGSRGGGDANITARLAGLDSTAATVAVSDVAMRGQPAPPQVLPGAPAAGSSRPRRAPHSAVGPVPLRVGVLRSYIKALSGTFFAQQDWANARGRPESVDTIMCLSVTKWVHLNNGDVGLKRLFKKMYDILAPGGLLILEPQQWTSYKRAVHKTTTNAVPFKRIEQLQLRPQHFVDYLTTQVGFVLEMRLHEGEGMGFDRPMYLLRKLGTETKGAAAMVVTKGQVGS